MRTLKYEQVCAQEHTCTLTLKRTHTQKKTRIFQFSRKKSPIFFLQIKFN